MSNMLLRMMILLALVGVAACTRTQDVLEPSAIAPQERTVATMAGDAQAPATVQPAAPAPASAPAAAAARIQFDPIVGATVETAAPLTERLVARARERGIRLAGNADPAATHVLKGYFSASTEGAETTVIYVWDIYDPAGVRLHRVNGQFKAPSGGNDGWASVTPATMQAVADQSAEQLFALFASRSG